MASKSAQNMEAIYKAKQNHDNTCPWGGVGKRIYMSAFDIERMGWEEGDNIAGLTVIADGSITTGRFRVECDAEPNSDSQIDERVENKDLVKT